MEATSIEALTMDRCGMRLRDAARCRFFAADATCYVGNLDERVTDALLWELFVQAGPLGMASSRSVVQPVLAGGPSSPTADGFPRARRGV